MLPEISVLLDCPPTAKKSARYSVVMLGLIAGFRPRFVREFQVGEAGVRYAADSAGTDSAGADSAGADSAGAEAGDGETILWLPASPQAWETLGKKQVIEEGSVRDLTWNGVNVLSIFPVAGQRTDVVAAAFYFLSLHGEWSSTGRDQFNRFYCAASLQGTRGEMLRPAVYEYAMLLRSLLRQAGLPCEDSARFAGRRSAICMTHDIDYLSKFTIRHLLRETAGNLLLNRRRRTLAGRLRRFSEYLGFMSAGQDPYKRSIRRMLELEEEKGIRATWFFKAGGKDKRDVSYRLRGRAARSFMRDIAAAGHEIGIHPSFNAYDNESIFKFETTGLRLVSDLPIRAVRQHYLRFSYPRTWRIQSENGLRVDSTLGFADHEGFRNGTCHPFLAYDLDTADVLPLWEVPLVAMDGTLAHYRGLSTAESAARFRELIDAVRSCCGAAALLFHNTVYDLHDFPGWDDVFEKVADYLEGKQSLGETLNGTIDAWIASSGYGSTDEIISVINNETN